MRIQRLITFSAMPAIACMIVVSVTSTTSLLAQTPPVISPAKVFDLRPVLTTNAQQTSVTIHRFRTARTGLYFLVAPGSNTQNSVIIQTDYQGLYRGLVRLPQGTEAADFDVDENGFIYVLAFDRKVPTKESLLTYAVDRTLSHTTTLTKPATALVLARGVPTLLCPSTIRSTVLRLDATTPTQLDLVLQRPQTPAALVALPDGRIVVTETTAAVLHFVDLDKASVADYSPRVPEMAWLSTLTPGNSIRNVAFSSVTSTSTGMLLLLIGHYTLAEGAPLVSMHINGNLPETIRCKLPQFPDEKNQNNTTGEMVPAFVSAGIGSGFALVSGNGKVALYPL